MFNTPLPPETLGVHEACGFLSPGKRGLSFSSSFQSSDDIFSFCPGLKPQMRMPLKLRDEYCWLCEETMETAPEDFLWRAAWGKQEGDYAATCAAQSPPAHPWQSPKDGEFKKESK